MRPEIVKFLRLTAEAGLICGVGNAPFHQPIAELILTHLRAAQALALAQEALNTGKTINVTYGLVMEMENYEAEFGRR